jgi:hypothetical protein
MFHETHPAITRPTLLVVVSDYVLIVGVWVLCEESLDQVTRVFLFKLEYNEDLVYVSHVETDWVSGLSLNILETHELIGRLHCASQFKCPLFAKDTEVKD